MRDIIELHYSMSLKKSPNSGIEILKILLTFLILVYHCLHGKENVFENKLLKFLLKIVPLYFSTYFVIFFYFTYSTFTSRNITNLKQRFQRILVPYIVWPIIFSVLYIISSDKVIRLNDLIKDLFIQYLLGRRICFVFWFQFNLLLISLIFIIILICFKKSYILIFQILFLIAYILEYLGFVEMFLESYNEDIKRSIGRTLKMMIFAITGFTLASIKLLYNLKHNKIRNIFLSIIFFIIVIFLKIYYAKYYYLEGIFLILGSTCLIISFSLLPLNNITNMNMIFLIKQSTSYTAGIYYIHMKVHTYLENRLNIFKEGSLRACVLIYLFCYFICFIGMKMVGKTKYKYLFI